jgi:hypothetical protein
VVWGLTKNGKFSAKSLYRFLTSGGMPCRMAKKIWKCRLPLKIRIFIWQILQDRLQTAQQLKTRKWRGSELCVLCGQKEDINHLFFSCPLAEFIRSFMGEALGWNGQPRSMNDLITEWVPQGFGASYEISLTCFAGVAWAIWNAKNKMCFNKSFPNKPTDVIYLGLSFIQKWRLLKKEHTRTKMEAAVAMVGEHLRKFRPSGENATDVCFL